MPRVLISVEERRTLEQELERLEAERQTLTNRIPWARAQDSACVGDVELHAALDDLTLNEGRIQQLQAVLAAAKPHEAGGRREDSIGRDDDRPAAGR